MLGFSSEAYLPNNRGFDSFYGFYGDTIGFTNKKSSLNSNYYDLHNNMELVTDESELSDDMNSVILLQNKAEAMVADHATK
jgi:hypothetical protein